MTDPENHVSTIAWDCYIGKQTTFTDMSNGVSTTYSYTGDLFDRLLEAKQAVSKTEETHVAFSYPNLTTVTTKQDQTILDDGVVQTTVLFDGLGRKVNSERAFGGCWLSVQQTYDAKGRPWAVSLPYNTCSESAHYQTTTYDGANRVYQVKTDDGAGTTTTYSGNIATVTDAALSTRDLTTDGLGRLTSVVEHTSPSNYTTGYLYNVADDLTSVTQGALTRTFTYDSLKRLITAINPESGTTCYGSLSGSTCTENYDNNGNLLSKVDGASVTTNYSYDSMNRLTGKSYTGGVTPTPPVTLTYNGAGSCPNGGTAYNLRRLTSVSTTASGATPSTAETWSYDALGRVCSRSESVGSVSPGSFAYKYNLASGILTETYPSLRAISTSYDVLNRPIGVNGVSTTYANTTGTYYASNDALAQLQLGPPTGTGSGPLATQGFVYDQVRQQLSSTTVTSGLATGPQLLQLGYTYCSTSCSTNNGNVQSATIVVPSPNALNLTQSFGYDKVNRLTCADEISGASSANCGAHPSPLWTQAYSYDAWGNRAVSGYIPNPNLTPEATSEFSNNQWTLVGSAYKYDLAGNQTSTGTRTSPTVIANSFSYDGENRMVTANMAGMGTVYYAYDGQGRRVQKTVGSTVTAFIYDDGGALSAEYGTGSPSATGTEYLLADALGSTRLVLDYQGNVKERLDYLPFGEELPVGVGGRAAPYSTGNYPTGPDIESQKFTGKERDAETGLDYFGARYMSGAQGRFTSADPITVTAGRASDPQQLNLYSYGRNNPLKFVDPTGMLIDYSGLSDKDKKTWQQVEGVIYQQDGQGNYLHPELVAAYDALVSDTRVYAIADDSGLGRSLAGQFTITKFDGPDNFSEARIGLNFNLIKGISSSTPGDFDKSFDKYDGLFGKDGFVLRLAETAGHEINHGIFAQQDPPEALRSRS